MTTRTDPAPEPYGAYVCADGRQVLYDRHYKPIWQRRPGQPATVADSEEWVKWDSQGWFYSDSDCHKKATLRRLQTVMRLFRTGRATAVQALHPCGAAGRVPRQRRSLGHVQRSEGRREVNHLRQRPDALPTAPDNGALAAALAALAEVTALSRRRGAGRPG